MAQLLSSGTSRFLVGVLVRDPKPGLVLFQRKSRILRAGRVSCLFSDGRKKEEARKALENALSEKKADFEEWNKQIEKREQRREGGGGIGGGGWFGGGGWYSWFGRDEFWDEAPKALLIFIVGIGSLYLLLAKGKKISAIIFNPVLDVLRKIRETIDNVFFQTPQSEQVPAPVPVSETVNSSFPTPTSAKDRVVRKWAMD